MERETFNKAKQIDTMIAVLKEERTTLATGGYECYVVSGIGQNNAETRLAGIDSDLMDVILQWYNDRIRVLESEFAAL